MRITKYTHSCLRLEHQGGVLVIDPGIWTEAQALTGADAVLITHEHPDHLDAGRLAGLGIPVFGPAGADLGDLDCTRVTSGDQFSAAGFDVRAAGGRHAFVYDRQPDCANLGYLVDGSFYHPGDSLHQPGQPVEILCVPAQASWLKLSEAIDFVQAIRPKRLVAIHDGQLNERGLAAVTTWLGTVGGDAYRYLEPGQAL
jgi:L-ascorbate metabolism protein UlaG (beta-lactamase superfamily)